MKKLILSLAILVAASFTMTAAHTAQSESQKKETAECCKKEKKDRDKNKKGPKKDGHKGPRGAFNPTENLFNGIQLTDAQKAQINDLQKNYNAPVKRDSTDKNLTDEQKKEKYAEMKKNRENAKKDYLSGMKNILTPDQYIIFLENNFLCQNSQSGFRYPQQKITPKGDMHNKKRADKPHKKERPDKKDKNLNNG